MLLDDVKDYLRITGNGENDDIEKRISRGKAKLIGKTGTPLDFEVEGLANSLLLDYCRYDYNNASEYFEENFSSEILQLQLQSAVKDYAENQT